MLPKKEHFHAKKGTWLSICPETEGVEPLSKFPALLEEAAGLIQVSGMGTGIEKPFLGFLSLPKCGM